MRDDDAGGATIANVDDLHRLRHMSGLGEVVLRVGRFKRRGLYLHALKYGLWAVRQGGRIVIEDDDPESQSIDAYAFSATMARQVALSVLGPHCTVDRSGVPGRIVFTRTTDVPADDAWSAGVVFSGADKEIETLHQCLDGLMRQPRLTGEGGEIVVCGPARDMAFLDNYPSVRYLEFQTPPEKPFPISRKKNSLMASMRNRRMLVFHARIVMDDGALERAPLEFDMLAPTVDVDGARGRSATFAYGTIDAAAPLDMPRSMPLSTRQVFPKDYMTMLRGRRPFVDGAAFMVTKQMFDRCALDPNLLWGDNEDVEWCLRAGALGYLCDLDLRVSAITTTSKAGRAHELPLRVFRTLQWGQRLVTATRNRLRALFYQG